MPSSSGLSGFLILTRIKYEGMNVNKQDLTFQLGAPCKSKAVCGEVEVFQVLRQNAVVLLKDTEANIFILLTEIRLIVI